ncbi:MAG TPA: ATP-binding protein [Rubrobacteraceae bacterium]|nr:ATP-binding protein [Rubrobacteraceae bacterium]
MKGATVADTLRRVPLFKELPDDKLTWISEQGQEVLLGPGTKMVSQGDPPDGFYVVLEGESVWTRRVGSKDVFVVSLGEGSVFSKPIMVLDAPYPTAGHAVTPMRLLKLDAPTFWELLKLCPEIPRGILTASVERAGLHESVSQRHAKLVSLGTMAAGLAHELNNPAAAAGRSAQEARDVFRESSSRAVKLGFLDMSPEERLLVAGLAEEVTRRAENTPELDSLDRSDREDEVALWLEDHGVEEGWDLAPTLVGAGLDVEWLDGLEGRLSASDAVGDVLGWLASELMGDELLREIRQASARVSELVGAVKAYSHMDKSSLREADVRKGLENTLTMLGHKLKKGDVEVRRDYEEGLPPVCAHGGELNQVWTNLLDNAIDALEGDGHVGIKAVREGDRVLVEISDNGPGIPEEIRERIFEPFFTTKEVGEGTGLGLDISYRVVVQKLGGDIRVFSKPGDTRFEVRLPVSPGAEGPA